jgi:hypothetical protein
MTTALERLATALADRYRIDHEIGSGGMATVYLAHDVQPELDRRVAIKVLHPEYSSAVAVERFLREVALATCYRSTGRRAEIAAKRHLGFRLLQDDPRMAAIHRRIGCTD